MPGIYKDEAIVLKAIKLGEADRILTLFMRDSGKVRAVAKGVRKTKSRFGGRLEPYTRVGLMLYKGRGDLDTITSADIVDAHHALRLDYDRLMAAGAMAELIDKIAPDRERLFPIYSLLAGGLDALARGAGPAIVPAFIVKLLSLSGFHPQLRACSGCGRGTDLGGFSSALGGVVCASCWNEDPEARRMAPDRIALLVRLLAEDLGAPGEREAVVDVTVAMRHYAEYHLERPLKSLHLLAL
jgi:DNA repair protein RecO (recombination protein O)